MARVYYPKAVALVDAILHDYGDSGQKPEFHFHISPKSVSVNINSYNLADTFNMSVRFEDFPFDPRLIRSLRVTIIIMDLKQLRDFTLQDVKANLDKAIFTGFADTHSIKLDQSERLVTMEGRDYTALLIDSTFDNANLEDEAGKRTRKIDLNKPVKSIIQDLLSNVPAAKNIQIEDRSGRGGEKFLKAVPTFSLVSGEEASDGLYQYTDKNETYWDVIVDICESAALICYIELDKLVLTTPRILYEGGVQNKKTLQFIYGFNLMNLEFFRNLGKKRKFNILVKSFNVRTNERIQVSIPRDADAGWANSMNIDKAIQKVKELNAEGVAESRNAPAFTFLLNNKTKEELVDYGQKLFEEFVRQQLEGSCETHEMIVNDDQGAEFDITRIRVGTPIKIEIAQEDVRNILRTGPDGEKISDGQRTAYLVRRGYPPKTAEALIKAVSQGTGKLRPTFYTREAIFDFSENGFACRIGFVNYIQLGSLEGGKVRSG